MFSFVNAILGAIVWLVANVVYVDLKRKGIHGFTRFAAFWVGTPTTWISLFAVRERAPETFSVEDDGGERLLAEIRRDRALRPGERPMDDEGPDAPRAEGELVEGQGDPAWDDAAGDADGGATGDTDSGGDGGAPLARSRAE